MGSEYMEILSIPSWKGIIQTDGIILGIKGLSVNLPFYIEVEELEEFCKQKKKIFIMLNKNMHNKDLEKLKNVMLQLEKFPISGVFYYDISIVNLKQKLHVTYPLIWSQEHLTTNASTCNFWASFGVSGAYLSSEITLEEISEIRKNTKIALFVNVFGHIPMFDSKRHLVKNYLNYFKLKESGDLYYIEKEGKKYPIVDDENGTTVYSTHILNAISEILYFRNIDIDYVILNSFGLENETFQKIEKIVMNLTEENKEESEKNVNTLCQENVDKGFLYTETVYKIKGEIK